MMRMPKDVELDYERACLRAGLFEVRDQLRRIALTLQGWHEAECNGEVQVDEDGIKARRYYGFNGPGPIRSYPIPNREAGAIRRLKTMLPGGYSFEVQGDPRGWPLTITTPDGLTVSPPPMRKG